MDYFRPQFSNYFPYLKDRGYPRQNPPVKRNHPNPGVLELFSIFTCSGQRHYGVGVFGVAHAKVEQSALCPTPPEPDYHMEYSHG